jgi:hypothetical protein
MKMTGDSHESTAANPGIIKGDMSRKIQAKQVGERPSSMLCTQLGNYFWQLLGYNPYVNGNEKAWKCTAGR